MKYYLVRKLFEKLRKQKEGNAGVRYEKAEILQKPLFIEEYSSQKCGKHARRTQTYVNSMILFLSSL